MRRFLFLGSLIFTKNPSNKTFQKQMCYTYLLLGKRVLDFGVGDFVTYLCHNSYQCLRHVMQFQFGSYTDIISTNVKNVTARAPTLVSHYQPWPNLRKAATTSPYFTHSVGVQPNLFHVWWTFPWRWSAAAGLKIGDMLLIVRVHFWKFKFEIPVWNTSPDGPSTEGLTGCSSPQLLITFLCS